MRQIVLDTETTGLDPAEHRIIEIGAVELDNRQPTGREYNCYLNPQREIDEGATDVHGITLAQLQDKPLFAEVVEELMEFFRDAQLLIHNAPFDIGFLDAELARLEDPWGNVKMGETFDVLDTLTLARQQHPGQSNNLDVLCRRYRVDNSARGHHGALLDARLLMSVYLCMTGGKQGSLTLDSGLGAAAQEFATGRGEAEDRPLKVIRADAEECAAHEAFLADLSAGKA